MTTINTGAIPTDLQVSSSSIVRVNTIDINLTPSQTSQLTINSGEIPKNMEVIVPTLGYNTYIAGENISGHTPVYLATNGLVYTCNPSLINTCNTYIGITTGASAINTIVQVQSEGVITFAGWALIANSPVFIGTTVTTTYPTTPFLGIIGYASNPTTVILQSLQIIIKG